jgi:hypothetical protein
MPWEIPSVVGSNGNPRIAALSLVTFEQVTVSSVPRG